MRTLLAICAVLAISTPALALDYDCSPITGGCVPRASQPSSFDPPYQSNGPRTDRCVISEGRNCDGSRRYRERVRR